MAVADFLPSRYYALTGVIAVTALASVAALFDWRWLFLAGAAGVLSLAGLRDYFQTRHAILRNYPLLAHFRFFFRGDPPGNPPISARERQRSGAVLTCATFACLSAC